MTKKQFIREMIRETGLLKEDAVKITDCVFEQIRRRIMEGHEVRIGEVGRFAFKFRSARTMQNNLTGKVVKVKPKVRLKFRAFPAMQRALNKLLASGEFIRQTDSEIDDE